MKKIFRQLREDTCPDCETERSLELYDRYNNPLRFSHLLDRNALCYLDNKKLSHFKCKKCGKVFHIKWTGDKRNIPRPLQDIRISDFMTNFKKKVRTI